MSIMSMDKESNANVFFVAGGLCLICAFLVSVAAVSLRGLQEKNALNEMRANVLKAAHLVEANATPSAEEIEQNFQKIDTVVIDLKTGRIDESIDPAKFDMRVAEKDPNASRALKEDPAGIRRQPNHAKVYLVKEGDRVTQAVLPVNGYGLWSTMYGFVSVSPDQTIDGISFYQQQETPGLGGEISNPKWQALWKDVEIYNANGVPAIRLVKNPSNAHEVDTLAGASLTSRGVANMVNFWMSEEGYRPFLQNLADGNL